MSTPHKKIEDVETLLASVEKEVLTRYKDTLRFIRTSHKSTTTTEYQTRIDDLDIRLIAIREALLHDEWGKTEFAAKAGELRERCTELGRYTEKMQTFLANDLVERHRAEEKARVDVIKHASFAFGPPGVFAAAFKAGLGEGFVNIYEVFGAGFAVSAGILCYRKLSAAIISNVVKAEERDVAARVVIQSRKEPTLGLG
jgi:hypothetical protein